MRRVGLPPGGSTLITSAPSPASVRPQYSACSSASSITRMPEREPAPEFLSGAAMMVVILGDYGRGGVTQSRSTLLDVALLRTTERQAYTDHAAPKSNAARAGSEKPAKRKLFSRCAIITNFPRRHKGIRHAVEIRTADQAWQRAAHH